jgi:hypothetical protein
MKERMTYSIPLYNFSDFSRARSRKPNRAGIKSFYGWILNAIFFSPDTPSLQAEQVFLLLQSNAYQIGMKFITDKVYINPYV